MRKTTKEEKLQKKRDWYYKNHEKAKATAKKSREKHKERRKLENKLWVERNKEKVAEYQKEYRKGWYIDNKEAVDAKNKDWAKNNPKEAKAIKDRFIASNPEVVAAYLNKYGKTSKGKYRSLKGSAVKRGYAVQITYEQFLTITSYPCDYCGEDKLRIGIDRIDNTEGYTLSNSAPCCTMCNMMKKTSTVKDFIDHVEKIHNHTLSTKKYQNVTITRKTTIV